MKILLLLVLFVTIAVMSYGGAGRRRPERDAAII